MEKKIEIKLEGKAAASFDKWFSKHKKDSESNRQRVLNDYLAKINLKKKSVA